MKNRLKNIVTNCYYIIRNTYHIIRLTLYYRLLKWLHRNDRVTKFLYTANNYNFDIYLFKNTVNSVEPYLPEFQDETYYYKCIISDDTYLVFQHKETPYKHITLLTVSKRLKDIHLKEGQTYTSKQNNLTLKEFDKYLKQLSTKGTTQLSLKDINLK